jgi:two-component system, OmpR family, response regulator
MTTRTLRILLVEDDSSIARAYAIGMHELGVPYQLDQAFSAEEGLELWQRQPYDLLLTDYNLRGMNGLVMIAHLKEQGFEVPTILFTAYDSAQVRRDARKLGVAHFIAKPFLIEELVNMARALLPIKASEMGAEAPGTS